MQFLLRFAKDSVGQAQVLEDGPECCVVERRQSIDLGVVPRTSLEWNRERHADVVGKIEIDGERRVLKKRFR